MNLKKESVEQKAGNCGCGDSSGCSLKKFIYYGVLLAATGVALIALLN